MSWYIHGRGDKLRYHVDGKGPPHIEGTAFRHECDPLSENTTYQECRTLSTSRFEIALYPSKATGPGASQNALAMFGLANSVAAYPDKVHYRLRFHPSRDPWLTCVVALPEHSFQRTWKLLRDVMLSPRLEYLIAMNFVGFRNPLTRGAYPTCQEFMNGRIFYEHESDFQLRVNPPNSDLEV